MELERAARLWPRSVKFRARRSVWRARELERRARRSPRYLREPLPMLEERSVRGAKKLASNPARQEKKLPRALKEWAKVLSGQSRKSAGKTSNRPRSLPVV